MKRIFTIVFLSLIFLIIDNTIIPLFSIKGIFPSFLFLFAICFSIINGVWEGLWLGVFTGILQDLYFFNGFGVNTLVNMLVCIIAAVIGNIIFKEKRLIPTAAAFGLSLLKGTMVFAILYVVKQYTYIEHIFFDSLCNMVICFFFYKWLYRFCQKDYMQRKWKFYEK